MLCTNDQNLLLLRGGTTLHVVFHLKVKDTTASQQGKGLTITIYLTTNITTSHLQQLQNDLRQLESLYPSLDLRPTARYSFARVPQIAKVAKLRRKYRRIVVGRG